MNVFYHKVENRGVGRETHPQHNYKYRYFSVYTLKCSLTYINVLDIQTITLSTHAVLGLPYKTTTLAQSERDLM